MKNYINRYIKLLTILMVGFGSISAKADLYTVSGVPVAAERASALAAKDDALAEGQVEAFNRLLAKLVGPERLTELPAVTTESVLPFVSGVSIESEKTTATKYMGSIRVQFNKDAVQSFLSSQQVVHLTTFPPTLLVVPVYIENDKTYFLGNQNILMEALKDQGNFANFYRAVVPNGDDAEMMFIDAAVQSGNLSDLSSLLPKYDKEKIMLLKLQHEGPGTWLISNSFYPQRLMDNQLVHKKFKVESDNKMAVAKQLSDTVFQEMESKWRSDKTNTLNDKQILYLRVPVTSLADWMEIEKQMKGWSFFDSVEMRGLYLPQVLVEVTYKGDVDGIEEKLAHQGWMLKLDFTGNGGALSRKVVYE